MSDTLRYFLEGTFAAVFLFLVLSHSDQFAHVLSQAGSTYAQGVGALQGPAR